MRLLIKNGTVIDPSQSLNGKYDILVEDGRIKDIRSLSIERDCTSIDADGCYVVPGLIDMHVHLRDPGFEEKEDILTGSEAAAAGGFTSIVCMPNTKPVIDNADTIKYIQKKAEEAITNVYIMGSITKGLTGETLCDYKLLKDAGIVGITDDGMTVMNAKVMYEALKSAKESNMLTSVHCEDVNLVYDNSIHQGHVSSQLGLQGRPSVSEDIIVERDILLAESLKARVHIQHVASKNSIELIRRAKMRGVAVSCEVTPHHFSLWDEYVLTKGTNAKMSPPLRSREDMEAIIEGIMDGTVDAIATDHAPHSDADKNKDLLYAANGIVGLETALGLALTNLVHSGKIDMNKLVELMSLNPAKLLGIEKGTLKIGREADITIIHPNKKWIVDKKTFKSKSKNTPFDGMELTGKTVATIVGGKVVYADER
ncbi:MAG: dihydroorotase [Clostridiales bacterium]|nr:dihydroorotase [Clostridiales bacterium]